MSILLVSRHVSFGRELTRFVLFALQCLVLMGVFQIYWLRRFFEKKQTK